MSVAVWKFPLSSPWTVTSMPVGATIRSVGQQEGQLCVWAECDTNPDAPHTFRSLRAVNTGMVFDPDGTTFLGTVQLPKHYDELGGEIVWHLYEVPM